MASVWGRFLTGCALEFLRMKAKNTFAFFLSNRDMVGRTIFKTITCSTVMVLKRNYRKFWVIVVYISFHEFKSGLIRTLLSTSVSVLFR